MVSSSLPADTFMVSTIVCVSFIGFRMASVPLCFPACFPASACFPGLSRNPNVPVRHQSAFLGNAWGTPNRFPMSFTIIPTEGVNHKVAEIKAYYHSLFPIITHGFSGGVWGLDRGYCMMIGGPKAIVDRLDPIFKALAPGLGNVPRTPGRDGRDPRTELGYLHCGPSGAGHFVKMIHNGIEYGLMQAFAEGFDIL